MDIHRGNWNCYNCGGFGYLARNCKNKRTGGRIGKGRRLEYRNRKNEQRKMIKGKNENNSNLNGDQDLILLD